MTQEQYNRYMDGLVLKVASKKLNKTASFRKRAENYGITVPTSAQMASIGIPSTGTGNGADVYQEAANRATKEVQDYYNNIMNPKKSWLDVAKGYGKQGIDWVKAHPYATAGGVATAALAAGLVGAYLLRKKSKKNTKTASIAKKAGMPIFAKALLSAGGAIGGGIGSGYALKYYLANQNDKEAQPSVPEMSQNDKSWLDAAKDYGKQGVDWVKAQGKQGVDWVKAHPYITGGAATAALVAGLVGAYLLRKDNKKNTKTASFRKRAYDFPLLSAAIEANKSPEQKIQEGIARAQAFKVPTVKDVELFPGMIEQMKYQESLGKTGLGKLTNQLRKDFRKDIPGTGDILTRGQAPRKFTLWDEVKFRAQDAKDYARETYDQGKSWIKENPVKAGLIGAAAVGIPAALIYAYYSRKNNKSKKSKK